MKARCILSSHLIIVILLATLGCRHSTLLPFQQKEPDKRQPPDEMRARLFGHWVVDQDYSPWVLVSLNLLADGTFNAVGRGPVEDYWDKPIEERALVRKSGKWCSDNGLMLVFGATNAIPLNCDGQILDTNCVFYPIIYVNDHELMCTPGVSMAGRIRFIKCFE